MTSPDIATGKLLVNPAGFAFVDVEGADTGIFIPPPERGGGMDGDRVVVSVRQGHRGPEGTVRSILHRHRTRITGVLRKHGRRYIVEPDDPRVLGRGDVLGDPNAQPGLVVVAAIVDYPDPWNDEFTVTVERTLGPPGSLATEEERILVEQGVDPFMPPAVLEAAKDVPTRVRKQDRDNRADLRDMPFMTIDPPDARDFDDAVCVEIQGRRPSQATMRVHIAVADVSHYVREGDVFDEEAVTRCFSTYLPARVIPMLPFELSSGICSLVPRKDRCAMVVSFDLESNGRMGDAEVRACVIRSHARLTYGQVAEVFEGNPKVDPEVVERIELLQMAADRLEAARRRRGSVELDLPEIKVKLDEDDRERVRSIEYSRSSPGIAKAYKLIEQLMVAANEGVGRLAVKYKLPAVYRVHAVPDEERIERFCAVADLLGVEVDPEQLQTPKAFQKFLRQIDEHPRRGALNSLMLRAMAQAEYSTMNVGHFALASSAYIHFTSPIRRYPDLINHRIFKAWIQRHQGPCGPEPVPPMPPASRSVEQARRSSDRERASMQAERDAKSLLCAAYMRDRIGDRFEGTISGMSMSGVFVTLDDPPVDGMIRRSLIEREAREPFEIDEMGARIVGAKSGTEMLVGDRVVVEVTDVSLAKRQIDFALMGTLTE
jgi:ribonuclease R